MIRRLELCRGQDTGQPGSTAGRLEVFGPDGALMDRGAVASFQCGAIDEAIFAAPAAG